MNTSEHDAEDAEHERRGRGAVAGLPRRRRETDRPLGAAGRGRRRAAPGSGSGGAGSDCGGGAAAGALRRQPARDAVGSVGSELGLDPVHHRAQLLALALDLVAGLLRAHALEVLLAGAVLGDPLARERAGLDLAEDSFIAGAWSRR